ncbi:MAG: hypothetical protein VCE75_23140 [Alphaproteobacteria bacterium]
MGQTEKNTQAPLGMLHVVGFQITRGQAATGMKTNFVEITDQIGLVLLVGLRVGGLQGGQLGRNLIGWSKIAVVTNAGLAFSNIIFDLPARLGYQYSSNRPSLQYNAQKGAGICLVQWP